jgi:type I restriction enzyme, S subunit
VSQIEVPAGWISTELGEILLSVVGGGTPSRKVSSYFDGAIPWFTVKDMKTLKPADAEEHITEVAVRDSATNFIPANTLIVATRISLGKAIRPTVPCAINQDLKALIVGSGINSNFLLYWVGANERTIQELGSGTTVSGIRLETLNTLKILLPPATEQTRIVEKLEELLSDLDAGVAELKAAQKKLAQYRQSLLKAAVEGALTAEWRKKNKIQETGAQLLVRILAERRQRWEEKQLAKFKEQGKTPPKGWQDKYPEPVKPDTTKLPELPEGWFYSDLEALIPSDKTGTKTGPFGSLLKKHEHQRDGVPVIGIENIDRMKFIVGSKIHITLEKASELIDYKLLPYDVVISRSGTVGEVCVIPDSLGEARFSTNIMRVRLEIDVLKPEYFCLLLNGSPHVLSQIRTLCSGSTRDFLNTEILKTLVFPVPPIDEQDKVLSVLKVALAEIEDQLAAVQHSLKQSAAQRKNILKSAFSGQLVPQDPHDEPASVLLERIRAERATRGAVGKRSRKVCST